jgi:hypothetical protein
MDTRQKNLLCKNNIVVQSKQGKNGCNLAEFSNRTYGPKEGSYDKDDDD